MFQSEENDSVESQDNGVVLVPAPAPTKPAWGKPATATPSKVNSGLPTEQTKSKSNVVQQETPIKEKEKPKTETKAAPVAPKVTLSVGIIL